MRRLVLVLSFMPALVFFSITGCAPLTNAYNVLTGASISPNQVYIAANAFDAVEATATNYIKLPPCATGGPVLCRRQTVVVAIVKAVRSGRTARDQLEAQVTSGNTTVSVSLFNALVGSTNTLQTITAQYGLK